MRNPSQTRTNLCRFVSNTGNQMFATDSALCHVRVEPARIRPCSRRSLPNNSRSLLYVAAATIIEHANPPQTVVRGGQLSARIVVRGGQLFATDSCSRRSSANMRRSPANVRRSPPEFAGKKSWRTVGELRRSSRGVRANSRGVRQCSRRTLVRRV